MDLYSITLLIAGLVFLFLGRRMFWLCAALVGLALGLTFGRDLFNSAIIALGIGIIFALIGGWLAVKFIKIAVWIIGFCIGVLIASWIFALFAWPHSIWYWLALLVGGLICAGVMGGFFDWGLVIVSSILGALLISNAIDGWLGLSTTLSMLVMLGLLVVGLVVQGVQLRTLKAATT